MNKNKNGIGRFIATLLGVLGLSALPAAAALDTSALTTEIGTAVTAGEAMAIVGFTVFALVLTVRIVKKVLNSAS